MILYDYSLPMLKYLRLFLSKIPFRKRYPASVMVEVSIFFAIAGVLALGALKGLSFLHQARIKKTAEMVLAMNCSLREEDLKEGPENVVAKLYSLKLNKSNSSLDSPPCKGSFEFRDGRLFLKMARQEDLEFVLRELGPEWRKEGEEILVV